MTNCRRRSIHADVSVHADVPADAIKFQQSRTSTWIQHRHHIALPVHPIVNAYSIATVNKMAGGWESLGLLPELVQTCEEDFDWILPSAIQDEAIPLLLGGGDVMVRFDQSNICVWHDCKN